MESLLRAGKETIEEVYQRHVVMLYRVAYSFMKNDPDAGRGPGNRPQPPEPGKKKTETDLGR